MSVLVDTNVLLRSVQPRHPLYTSATTAVIALLRQGQTVSFCPQNIAEFWHVATRPASLNGPGMTHGEVLDEVRNIESLLTLLPETPGIYQEWKRLVSEHKVQGIKVFDARLAAVATTYRIGSILTFNAADFRRYRQLTVLDPMSFILGTNLPVP